MAMLVPHIAVASSQAPAVVTLAAARLAAQDHIAVSFRWDQHQEIHASRLYSANERDSYAMAELGGRVIAARTLSMVNNGKPASAADMQSAARQIVSVFTRSCAMRSTATVRSRPMRTET